MPINYKLYQNHLTNGDDKYLARVEYLHTVYEEDVIDEMIFHSSSMTKADMLAALNAVPVPQGNLSHAYQGSELYFELFRYLTRPGKAVAE